MAFAGIGAAGGFIGAPNAVTGICGTLGTMLTVNGLANTYDLDGAGATPLSLSLPAPREKRYGTNGATLTTDQATGLELGRNRPINRLKIGGITNLVTLAAVASDADLAEVAGVHGSTGVLVTAAAAANQHGLPANFGAGRGQWAAGDLARLRIEIMYNDTATRDFVATLIQATDSNAMGTEVDITQHDEGGGAAALSYSRGAKTRVLAITLANGDLTIVVKNLGSVAVAGASILLSFEHSVQA